MQPSPTALFLVQYAWHCSQQIAMKALTQITLFWYRAGHRSLSFVQWNIIIKHDKSQSVLSDNNNNSAALFCFKQNNNFEAMTLLPRQRYKSCMCSWYFHAQAYMGMGKYQKSMYYLQRCTKSRMHNVSKYTLVFVTFPCPGVPGQESIKNNCIICNVVLAQVKLSQ